MEIRILIVDDHPTVRESLRYVFAAAGIGRLREATTWQEAIDAAREGDVDLVALDVALRAGNGLDILRDIKCLDASVPVLVHSYHDHPRLLSHCFHLGAAGYVVKGNDKNELIRAVRQTAVATTCGPPSNVRGFASGMPSVEIADLAREALTEVTSMTRERVGPTEMPALTDAPCSGESDTNNTRRHINEILFR